MHDFKQLRVWEFSRQFVKEIYEITKNFPANEQYAMTSQIKRASTSICANISEGSAKGNKEFSRYLLISMGSIKECENWLLLAKDLNYISETQHNELNEKLKIIAKMNYNLIKKINN